MRAQTQRAKALRRSQRCPEAQFVLGSNLTGRGSLIASPRPLGFGPEGPVPNGSRQSKGLPKAPGLRHLTARGPNARGRDVRAVGHLGQLFYLGSCLPGQLSHWGTCLTMAVVLPLRLSTWTVVALEQLSYLGSCLCIKMFAPPPRCE